jgi:hypothetical protein
VLSISPKFFEQFFTYESYLRSFFVLEVLVKFLLVKENWHKSAHKMLVKLTIGRDLSAKP